jgi:hypothetical protein
MGNAKKPLLTHASCREGGVVSIWLGGLRSEAEVDTYFRSGGFTRDFGFAIEPRDGPETDAVSDPLPVEQLLDGFSWSRGFLAGAVAAAKAAGWERANCAIVFLNFRSPPDHGAAGGPMSFLGTFPFTDRRGGTP